MCMFQKHILMPHFCTKILTIFHFHMNSKSKFKELEIGSKWQQKRCHRGSSPWLFLEPCAWKFSISNLQRYIKWLLFNCIHRYTFFGCFGFFKNCLHLNTLDWCSLPIINTQKMLLHKSINIHKHTNLKLSL